MTKKIKMSVFNKTRKDSGIIWILIAILVFSAGQLNAQTLRISSAGNTGTSGTNWSTTGSNPKIITATGTAHINTSVIRDYLNSGISVQIRNIASPGRIQVESPITKTSGGDATLTIRANGRPFIYNAGDITSTSGKLNIVLWSDYDNDGDGGVSLVGDLITNGGHVWLGGSSTNGGSLKWNGLTVGNGPSRGGTGENANGMDIFADVITSGGDFLGWAGDRRPGSNGIDGIANDGAGDEVNTGSGDIILITDRVNGDGSTAIFFETTGHFYLVPNDGAFKETFDWNPTVRKTYIDFGGNWNYMAIPHPENQTGLTIGRYDGMTTSLGIPVVQGNTSGIKISKDLTTKGPISLYGGTLEIGANLTSSSGNGDIVLEGSTSIKAIGANRTLSSGSGDVRLTTNWLVHNASPNYKLIVSSTGAFAFEPFGTAFSSYGAGLELAGSLTPTSKTFSGTGEAAGLQVNNTNNLTGLTFGKNESTTGIVTNTEWKVNGPISVYGNAIDINANLQSTASGASILLQSKGAGTTNNNGFISLAPSSNITTNAGDIILWPNAANRTSGLANNELILEGNNTLTSNGGKIVLAGGLDDGGTSSGIPGLTEDDGIPDGYIYRGSNSGAAADIRAGVTLNSGGGEIIIRGEQNGSDSGIELDATFTISNAGDVTIEGKNAASVATARSVYIGTANITATAANAGVTILGNTHIANTGLTTISTQSGDVLIAGNIDDATDGDATTNGQLRLTSGLNITTNGGDITLAGGDRAGTGYAQGATSNNLQEGVRIDLATNLQSDGGNIIVRGKTPLVQAGAGAGASGVGFYFLTGNGEINSDTGTVLIDGYSQTSGSEASAGVLFWNNTANTFTIQSANTTDSAITINAFSGANGAGGGQTYGLETEGQNTLNVFATGAGGGITFNTGFTYTGEPYDIVFRGPTNILANGGPISLKGGQNGGVTNGILYIGHPQKLKVEYQQFDKRVSLSDQIPCTQYRIRNSKSICVRQRI